MFFGCSAAWFVLYSLEMVAVTSLLEQNIDQEDYVSGGSCKGREDILVWGNISRRICVRRR